MNFQKALERIKTIAEHLEDDDPDKKEMLDVEGDYSGLMEWAIKKRSESLAMAEANKDLAKLYTDRKSRFENKADSMKDIIGVIMDCAGERKYQGIAGTVSITTLKPKPIVTDESKVPSDYKKEVIDKTLINQAIKDGYEIEGVSMSNGGESLTIRVR